MTRSRRAAQGVLLLGLAVSACSDSAAPPTAPTTEAGSPTVQMARTGPRRHVIVLREGSNADLRSVVQQLGGKVTRSESQIGTLTVEDLSDAAVATLARRPDVEGIDADLRVQWITPRSDRTMRLVHSEPIDQSGAFFFDRFQWYLRVIEADKAWLVSREGEGTTVCVLDTGVDPTHGDLQGRVDLSRTVSFVADEAATNDIDGHGTFVSALIAANGIGMASAAPKTNLCMVKVLDQTGSGSFSDIISGIVYATDAGADVINMSLGAYFSRREDGAKELIRALQRAVNYASRKGVVVVASAGNDGVNLNKDPKSYIAVPAELNHVISVGATAPTAQMNFDAIASYSNFGAKGVDVFAPGGDLVDGGQIEDLIFSACSTAIPGCEGGFTYLIGAGTSFAAPLVSAQAAILESQFPGNQSDEFITFCLQRTAENPNGRRRDRLYDYGRINILKSLKCGFGA